MDDRNCVKALLREDSILATRLAGKPDRLEPRIAHYIYTGDSLLHVAAAAYRIEIAQLLVAMGARVDAAYNRRHSQPLHYAADGHRDSPCWNPRLQLRTIELLLEAGADLHARDKNGATPLHRAVRTRCAEAVKALLAAGADATLRNEPGSTPFHLAVQNTGRGGSGSESARTAQREIIRAFLEHGVKPTLRDAKGKTVLDWAKNAAIRQMLAGRCTD